MKKTFAIFLCLLCHYKIRAQDLHFSQFNENPALLNPALTGASHVTRASLNYKEQWRSVTSPYKTYGASCETRFKKDNWQQVDKFRSMTFKEKSARRITMGLSVYSDKAGDANLGLSMGNLSLATFIPIARNQLLSVGLQGTIAQRKLDRSKLLFPNQYNGSVYDPGQASRENFSAQNFIYGDAALGALWSYVDKERMVSSNKQLKARVGFSMYHLSRAPQRYLGIQSPLYIKYIAHGDMLFSSRNTNIAFAPSFLLQFQGTNKEIIIGTMVRYYMNNSSKYTGLIKQDCLAFGIHYRNNDAAILSGMLELKEKYAIVMSYDVNLSALSSVSKMRGGLELTLRYTAPESYLYQKRTATQVN